MPQDIVGLEVSELGPLLYRREVSPVEVVTQFLDRIAAHNDDVVGYTHVAQEKALGAARAAETEILSGIYRSPLHGIPVAYKDVLDVAGMPTTAGSRLLLKNQATHDSGVVAALRRAGAICLGKLLTNEFATGGWEVFGEGRNPWNTDMQSGGSSAGPAIAVAGRLVSAAFGTDTGGSIRVPASFCGVVGLKPTYGRISRAGVVPLSWSLDHVGPIAHTVKDTAILLEAASGSDSRDPSSAEVGVPNYAALILGDVARLRLGVPSSFFLEGVHPEVEANFRNALGEFESLGAVITDVDLPHARFGPAASWTIAYTEAYAYHRNGFAERARDYTKGFVHKVSSAAFLTAEDRLTAQRIRQIITQEYAQALSLVDAIVTPTTAQPTFPVGGSYAEGDVGRLTRPVSLTGFPALSLSSGFTASGLPTSLQIVGRPWEEHLILKMARAYQDVTDWHSKIASLESRGAAEQGGPGRPVVTSTHAVSLDPAWVLAAASLFGLSYIEADDAEPISAALGPVRAGLEEARQTIPSWLEPHVRPAPIWRPVIPANHKSIFKT